VEPTSKALHLGAAIGSLAFDEVAGGRIDR
jgi:hypothetical protein